MITANVRELNQLILDVSSTREEETRKLIQAVKSDDRNDGDQNNRLTIILQVLYMQIQFAKYLI